jgi:hypothetical protein
VRGPRHARRSGGAPVAATNDERVRAKPTPWQLKVQEDSAPTRWRPLSSGFTMPSEELDF